MGRGIYCFYEADMNARMQARAELERDIQGALANGEFELFYQPIASLDGNKIISFEALLRWHHPKRGLVSPAEFIPIAEEAGLIIPLGEWVTANGVCRGGQLARRRSRCRQRLVGSVKQQEFRQCCHRRRRLGQYRAQPA